MSSYSAHSFLIVDRAGEIWDFGCDNGPIVDKYVTAIKEDMKANAGVANGENGSMEVYNVCVGFLTIDLSSHDSNEAQAPTTAAFQGGNIAAPLKLKKADVPERGGWNWYTPSSEIQLTMTPVDAEKSTIGTWVNRLPCMCCVPLYAVPFFVLYRTMMAEKLWQDAAGLHWSFLDPSDDPVIKWLPRIIDEEDLLHALCVLHAREYGGKLGKMALGRFSKLQVASMLPKFKSCVVDLYPLAAECPPPRLEMPQDLVERASKIAWYLAKPSMQTVFDATHLVKPFHTSELVSDTVDGLVPPEEAVYAAYEAGGHYGDQARGEITMLIGRLIELLERGLGAGDHRNNASQHFYSFFDAALPKSAIQNLMQWSRQSLEEVEQAFRRNQLRRNPEQAYQFLTKLQQAHAGVVFHDPYHCEMEVNGEKVYFLSTANAPNVWHISEEFFFIEAPQSPRNR